MPTTALAPMPQFHPSRPGGIPSRRRMRSSPALMMLARLKWPTKHKVISRPNISPRPREPLAISGPPFVAVGFMWVHAAPGDGQATRDSDTFSCAGQIHVEGRFTCRIPFINVLEPAPIA